MVKAGLKFSGYTDILKDKTSNSTTIRGNERAQLKKFLQELMSMSFQQFFYQKWFNTRQKQKGSPTRCEAFTENESAFFILLEDYLLLGYNYIMSWRFSDEAAGAGGSRTQLHWKLHV